MQPIRVLAVTDMKREMAKIGVDPFGVKLMAGKAVFHVIKIENVDHRVANILKQEILSIGGEAACARAVMSRQLGESSVLLMATQAQYQELFRHLSYQPFGLKKISLKIKEVLNNQIKPQKKLRIMGILNITPDSFSDGGKYLDPDLAVERGLSMAAAGADILDLGGESSRPGSLSVSAKEEINRILPVLKKLSKQVRIPLSIDTYKATVAKAGMDHGASIINDISALRADPQMAKFVARYKNSVILMHMLGEPRTMQVNPKYQDVLSEIYTFLQNRIEFAQERGIKKDKIIIDPGIGFGKTVEHNLEILRKLSEFKSLGQPILVGASRKSFIGKIIQIEETDKRLSGSLAIAAWSYLNGASILRVHDVKETCQLIKTLAAVKNK